MSEVKVAHITSLDRALVDLLLNQLRAVRDAGYSLAGISSPGPWVSVVEEEGICHFAVPIDREPAPVRDLVTLWQLYRVMRRERFTIVHTHNPKPGLLGQVAAALAGVPIIINTIHGLYLHDEMHPAKRQLYLALERLAARCSDVVLSQNREDIETLIRDGICPREKIFHLGNGIDLRAFDPDRFRSEEIQRKRAELNLPAEARIVGFVGRLAARRKGFLDYLKAAKNLAERYSRVYFVIAGDTDRGKADAVESRAAQELGIWDRCRFLGQMHPTELPMVYALMDILVLPSLFEGVPRVVMEASAMRVPVVATNVKGNREAVDAGRTGVLVPYGDVDRLTEALIQVLDDPAWMSWMGEEGRRMALERFDERAVFRRVLNEYIRLLTAKGLQAPSATSRLGPSG